MRFEHLNKIFTKAGHLIKFEKKLTEWQSKNVILFYIYTYIFVLGTL